MLPFTHYPILLITLSAIHVASSARISFLRITAGRIFFRLVSLAGEISDVPCTGEAVRLST